MKELIQRIKNVPESDCNVEDYSYQDLLTPEFRQLERGFWPAILGQPPILPLLKHFKNSPLKKLPKIETLTCLLWITFGLVGGLEYFNKEDYLISAIMFLVAIIYGYRLVRPKKKIKS